MIHALVTFKNRALPASTRYPPEYAVALSSEKWSCKLVLNLAKIPMAVKIEAESTVEGASVTVGILPDKANRVTASLSVKVCW